jgi:hypothetical protein
MNRPVEQAGEALGPWEVAGPTRGYSGRVFWTLRRLNPRLDNTPCRGWEPLLAPRRAQERRFYAEAKAIAEAEVLNQRPGGTPEAPVLTRGQKDLLASYLTDVCGGYNARLERADPEAFCTAVQGMELDGPAPAAELRAAKGLRALGYFAWFMERTGPGRKPYLTIRFSAAGARALYRELLSKRATPAFISREVSRVLDEAERPLDAYQVARLSGCVDVVAAARELQAQHDAGRASLADAAGDNACAWTYTRF